MQVLSFPWVARGVKILCDTLRSQLSKRLGLLGLSRSTIIKAPLAAVTPGAGNSSAIAFRSTKTMVNPFAAMRMRHPIHKHLYDAMDQHVYSSGDYSYALCQYEFRPGYSEMRFMGVVQWFGSPHLAYPRKTDEEKRSQLTVPYGDPPMRFLIRRAPFTIGVVRIIDVWAGYSDE